VSFSPQAKPCKCFAVAPSPQRGTSCCRLRDGPEAPGGSQKLPEAPRSSQRLPEAPRGSQRLPEAPRRGSQRLPEAPRGSQRFAEAPRGSQRLPEARRDSGGLVFPAEGSLVDGRCHFAVAQARWPLPVARLLEPLLGQREAGGLTHTFAKICILINKAKKKSPGRSQPFFLEIYSLTFRRPEFPVPTDQVEECSF
jgi:hypothetical protein